MSFFDFFRSAAKERRSADTAKERLSLLLSHERAHRNGPTFCPCCRRSC
jgi:septum formation topological specificity factor MinE